MNKLTCVIPFLNEGIEIFRTVKSIRDTAGDTVDIILINDASTDNIDYSVVAKYFNCKYFKNQCRQGVAGSRDLGVYLTTTEYCLLLDGHMRFYDNQWVDVLINEVSKNRRKVYCTSCVTLWWPYDKERASTDTYSTGAYLASSFSKPGSCVDPKWIPVKINSTEDVPLVLGANYCFTKEYYQELRGLEGLRHYGCSEAWLSLKSWAIGDGCAVIPQVKIGHVFREKHPYPVFNNDTTANHLLILLVIFPDKKGWLNAFINMVPSSHLEAVKTIASTASSFRKWFVSKEREGWRKRFNEVNNKYMKEGSPL